MKPQVRTITGAAFGLLFAASVAFATPIDFGEISLLVRAREPDASITADISQRHLAQKLTVDQEATLKKQGASDSLITSLRNAAVAPAPQSSVAAVGGRRASTRSDNESAAADDRDRSSEPDVQIVDVGIGEPVNLSAWGGIDREFVFHRRSITDLRRTYSFYERDNFPYYRDPLFEPSSDELTMIEPVGSFAHTSTYLGTAQSQPLLAGYTATTLHTFTRRLEVQRHNPVHIGGVPYNLYPIYAAGGVSLYYIGRISDEVVRLAVISHWR